MGTIGITHKWIPNFSEIGRLLTRLTGKMDWRWTASEQLALDILRIKCATVTIMYDYNYSLHVYFYTNVSKYECELIITQFQTSKTGSRIEGENPNPVEVSILYDFIIFNSSERRYRELCALIKFVVKYEYFCKHPRNKTIIHTDQKTLIQFLRADIHEGIYGHWTNKLRRLNLEIVHISERRNKVADDLSRILFHDEDYRSYEIVKRAFAAPPGSGKTEKATIRNF